MTTISLPSKAFRMIRFAVAVCAILSFGLVSAQARLISKKEAKAAAKAIMAASADARNNVAVTVATAYTLGTGANDAAKNAAMIVKYLPSKQQRLLAGRVGVGVAMNYPAQLAGITLKLAQLNDNMRKHVSLLVYQATLAGDLTMSDGIAYGMNLAIVKHSSIKKQTRMIADSMMSAICNRAGYTDVERANQLALIAANLSVGLSKPNKHGIISSDRKKAIQVILQTLQKYINQIAASSSDSQKVLTQAAVVYATTVQQAAGTSSSATKAVNYILNTLAKPVLQQGLTPENANSVSQAIDDVINHNPPPTGEVTNAETLSVDPDRQ